MRRIHKQLGIVIVLGCCNVYLLGCNFWGGSASAPSLEENQAVEGGLSLKNFILRQTDNRGRLVWKLKAKAAKYGETRKQINVKGLEGTLLQQNQPAYQVKAVQAQVNQKGDDLFLKGKVIITDLRSKGIFTAEEFEWHPEKQLLIARKNLKLTHPQLQLTAKEMQALSPTQQVTAKGQVVAQSPTNKLRLLTEQLVWQPPQQLVFAGGMPGKPVTGVFLQRLGQKGKTDTAQGGSLQANLKTQTVTLQSPAQLRLVDPLLEIDSEQLVWQMQQQTLSSDRPVKIYSPDQGVTLTGDRGFLNQAAQQAQINGNVKARGQRNATFLSTDQLIWEIPSQRINAQGNVFYRQLNPEFTLRGQQAIGLIQERKVVVTGGDVVTVIYPES